MMELTNSMYKYDAADSALFNAAETLLKLMAPIVPHFAEELWEQTGHTSSILRESYPEADESKLVQNTVEVPVQLLGKLKGTVSISAEASEEEASKAALELLGLPSAKKVIYKPGKIINIIA